MGNLHPGPGGWLWMDFEDVALMPRHWYLASFVARAYLLGESRSFSERLMAIVLGSDPPPTERRAFARALAARAVLSAVVNAALARQGHGDPELAERRIARLPALLRGLGEWLQLASSRTKPYTPPGKLCFSGPGRGTLTC